MEPRVCRFMTQLLITYCSLFRESTGTDIFSKRNDVLPEFVSTDETTETEKKKRQKETKPKLVRKIKCNAMTHWLLEFNWHFILHSFHIDWELGSQLPLQASWGAAKHRGLFMALRQPSLKVALITLKGLCSFLFFFPENFNHSLNFWKCFAPLRDGRGQVFFSGARLWCTPWQLPIYFTAQKTWTMINKIWTELRQKSFFFSPLLLQLLSSLPLQAWFGKLFPAMFLQYVILISHILHTQLQNVQLLQMPLSWKTTVH